MEGTIYLGWVLNFNIFNGAEIYHRVSRGWAAFDKFKQDLCCKHCPLKHRMKLFDATASSTVLWRSGTWTMTKGSRASLENYHVEDAKENARLSEETPGR